MKKTLASLMLIVLMLGLMPINAAAAERYQVTVPAERNYSFFWPFSEGLAVVQQNGKWGAINESGKEVIPITLNYDWVGSFHNGLAQVRTAESKYGFINTAGKEVVTPKYFKVRDFCDGVAIVGEFKNIGVAWGAIDTTGKVVIPIKYIFEDLDTVQTDGFQFKNGLACVSLAELGYASKYGYINTKGQEVIPLSYKGDYDYIKPYNFSDGLAWVPKGVKWGAINTSGKVVIPFDYDVVEPFNEGLAWVRKGQYAGDGTSSNNVKWAAINTSGKVVVPYDTYETVRPFEEGYAAVEKNGKWGFVSAAGQVVIPFEYDEVGSFSEGLAEVSKNGKGGYINTTGQEVIALGKYVPAGSFWGGIAPITNGDGTDNKYINTKGDIILTLPYNGIVEFKLGDKERYCQSVYCSMPGGLIVPPEEQRSDLVDASGIMVKNVEYEVIEEFHDGIAWFRKDMKFGIIKDTAYVPNSNQTTK